MNKSKIIKNMKVMSKGKVTTVEKFYRNLADVTFKMCKLEEDANETNILAIDRSKIVHFNSIMKIIEDHNLTESPALLATLKGDGFGVITLFDERFMTKTIQSVVGVDNEQLDSLNAIFSEYDVQLLDWDDSKEKVILNKDEYDALVKMANK